ncbi:hypothetical protein [Zhihengliuella halotolerans]|uniref:hypothetical protein n=1 Tax=Zhihengliuella halotolerans TaxID=370736 RepID=UPI000C7FBFB8|nr:hypothetical protein [Zhihengliuella halotolerans]
MGQRLRKNEVVMRRAKALQLRAARLNYRQIADRLYNGDVGNCWRDIQKAVNDLQQEAVVEVRAQEIELLDQIARPMIKRVMEHGDEKAAMVVLKVMERRAKYLGLDAPAELHTFGSGEIRVVTHEALQPGQMVEAELIVDEATDASSS